MVSFTIGPLIFFVMFLMLFFPRKLVYAFLPKIGQYLKREDSISADAQTNVVVNISPNSNA